MRIAAIGAGKVGSTLGGRWIATGHQVTFGLRNPKSDRARELRKRFGPNVSITDVGSAAAVGDVVLMAVPGMSVEEVLGQLSPFLSGKVVLDATNRLDGGRMSSLAAYARMVPDAHVFRAFNSLSSEVFAQPLFDGVPADLFFCGPQGDHAAVVETLIADLGLRPIWVGELDEADFFEGWTRIWFTLAMRRGWGRHIAFKLLADAES